MRTDDDLTRLLELISEQSATKTAERLSITKADVEEVVRKTVQETFLQLGVASDNPLEMQKDMQHLRRWRESVESIQSKGVLAMVTVLVSGVLAAFWVGFKEIAKH